MRINSHSDSKFQYTAGVYAFTQKGYEPTTNTAYELSDAEAAAFVLPSGTYFYIIDYNNGEKPVSGYIEFIK